MILYDSLGYYYSNNNQQDKALDCFRSIEALASESGISLSQSLKNSELNGIAGCYKKIGVQYINQEDFEISLDFSNKALEIYNGLGNNQGSGSCYNNIGVAYMDLGNNLLALDYLLKSLKINENLAYKLGIAHCCLNIAIVYTNEKNYTKAQDYIQNAFRIFKELKNQASILKAYNIFGGIYSGQGKYNKAIEFYNKGLKISEELNDEKNMANILNNIGDVYMNLADYAKALEYFNRVLNLNEKNEDKINKLLLYNNIANTYLRLKRYKDALKYALKSSASAEELKELFIENDSYKILKETYHLLGDYKKAKEYADLYESTHDSLFNAQKSKQILEIQTKYDTEKNEYTILKLEKEKQIQELNFEKLKEKKKSQLITFLIIIFLVVILAIITYSRYIYKQNNIKERALSMQRELRYQDVIEAQEKERKRIAEDLHDSLGQMLSTIKLHMVSIEDSEVLNSTENQGVLNNAIGYIDDACNEVRNISHHLMPGALIRLGLIPALGDMIDKINKTNKVKINFKSNGIEKRLNEFTEINLYRIIQELIGNDIKHSQATKIDINISQQKEKISLTIIDNGKGFDTSKIHESKGIGWQNIYSRLAMLNGKFNISSEINKGTKIYINFTV